MCSEKGNGLIFIMHYWRGELWGIKKCNTINVSILFSAHVQLIQRIWKWAKDTTRGANVDISHRGTKNCVCKSKINLQGITDIPLNQQTRSLATTLGFSRAALHESVKKGLIHRH